MRFFGGLSIYGNHSLDKACFSMSEQHNQKKKILFYSGHCEIVGGDAKYIFQLINKLDIKDFQDSLYTDINPVFEQRAQQWLKKDVPVHYLDTKPRLFHKDIFESFLDKQALEKTPRFLKTALSRVFTLKVGGIPFYRLFRRFLKVFLLTRFREDLHNFLLFYRIFKAEKPDIFHFNNGGYPGKRAGLWAIPAARLCGVPNIIMTIQNLPMQKAWYRPSDLIFDFMMAHYCDRIITVSEKLRQCMASEHSYPLEKSQTVFHGLDDLTPPTAEIILQKKNSLNLPQNAPLLLIVSNIDEDRKGHAVLFQALETVIQKHPQVILLVVGDGSLRPHLETLVRSSKISNNVRFLGHRSDIAEINSMIDIAIVPSIAFEGIPYTIREAMRAGKPVITTDAGGCDEAIVDQVSGILVEQKNHDQLAKAINDLLDHPEKRIKMGEKSRELFLARFFLDNKVKEHLEIYSSCDIKNNRANPFPAESIRKVA